MGRIGGIERDGTERLDRTWRMGRKGMGRTGMGRRGCGVKRWNVKRMNEKRWDGEDGIERRTKRYRTLNERIGIWEAEWDVKRSHGAR